IKTRLQGYPSYFLKGETTSEDSQSTEGSNYPNMVNRARRIHDLHFTIRKFLRVPQGLGNTSCKFAPTTRHTHRQRVGVQSDNTSPENLKIATQDSYPRCNTLFRVAFVLGPTPKSDRKWPESRSQNQPKSNSKIKLPRLKIDEIIPNHQLDHEEWMNFHTLITKNGPRRREIGAGEVSSKNRPKNHVFRRLERRPMSGKGRV
ncbi:unnamed protein product, partial [Prunus brigantina]